MAIMSDSNNTDTSARNDYDSPWKEILESYFEECMAFFFPDVHRHIDWDKEYVFLDKELQQIARDAEIGKRFVDKLVKVWTFSGDQVWVLVHIEVQSQPESAFAKRMYTYHYRLHDQFNRPIASFAILSDSSPHWRPDHFSSELWGCSVDFKFRTAKLLDYQQQWDELLVSSNPFAVVVMAHLKALETSGNSLSRKQSKLSLIKGLYQRGYERQDVIKLLKFIDWLIALPVNLEADLWQDIRTYQNEMNMPYITSFEQIAKAEGREEGEINMLKKSLKLILEVQFGDEGIALADAVDGIFDIARLESVQEKLVRGQLSLDELQERLQ